jgi:hypothetical protein
LTVRYSARAGEIALSAVGDLVNGLGAMLARPIETTSDASLDARSIRIALPGASTKAVVPAGLEGESFTVTRAGGVIAIAAGSERALIHAAANLLERWGAKFPPGAAPIYPRLDDARLGDLASYAVTPAFKRRAFASDIMTWNYGFAHRLEMHLAHDREFIAWMARRGVNAFSYITHAHDTRLKIDELSPELGARGIDAEYGGHVLQLLMPRDAFEKHPEYFPAGDDGARQARGNLCVSNTDAISLVRGGALKYLRDYPENSLLHIWGADVRGGAWCRCGSCRELSPQIQYMAVVNAIGQALGGDAGAPPVAYLAYHDTIEPHRGLRPLKNVWFEWAPRERCYVHAIDDADCEINPRYLDSLKRYIDLFDGRGHVFEYYADAILFGGLGFATPAVIADDLRCYCALGLRSVSCLTFGAFSALAYPVNLEAFVRGTSSLDFDPEASLTAAAAGRHPDCTAQFTDAYRAIARATKLVLDYSDVMSPARIVGATRDRKREEMTKAAAIFDDAVNAADSIIPATRSPLADGEKDLWRYSRDVLSAMSDYLAVLQSSSGDRTARGEAVLARIAAAAEHVHRMELPIKGTWGAYDLEWIREMWLRGMRRGLEPQSQPAEELF